MSRDFRPPAGDPMNVTTWLGGTAAGVRSFGLSRRAALPEVARLLTRVLIVVALFTAAGVAGLGLYASSHQGRIYQGVHVAGLDLGGLSAADARARLDAYFADYAGRPLTLTAGDQSFQITPADAGARLDSATTIASAMDWGRQGSPWDQSRAWARALVHGVSIAPAIHLDPDAAHSSIAAIAPKVVKPAIDATLAFGASGRPEIVPDVTGTRLDYSATESLLANRIVTFAHDPVPMVTEDDPADVTTASLTPNLPEADAAVDAPLILSFDDAVWHIPAGNLRPLLGVDPATSNLRVDRRPLHTLVAGLATEIDRDAVDASITVDENGRLAVVPAVSAARVDVDASVAAIAQGLLAGEDEIALVVDETPAEISDAMAAAAVARGEDLLDPGIRLTWDGGQGLLDRGDLLHALTIRSRPGADEPFVFALDPDLVRESLERY